MIITVIEGGYFRLFTYNEDGTRENTKAYTRNENTAKMWKDQSKWNGYAEIQEPFVFIETLTDMIAMKQVELVNRAKAKLSKEELNALIQSIQQQ